MIVNCVVVTYNRLDLLKENINALKKQTYPLHKIFIIDNCSTDKTPDYLLQFTDDSQIENIRMPQNVGGAGGFNEGMKRAVLDGCDYVWIMDDDTIPNPDALEKLVQALELSSDIGFLCSKVVWTDNSIHKMNKPGLKKNPKGQFILVEKDRIKGYVCKNCTFVSVLFSAESIFQIGLPIKEFFIWHDDIEYTERNISHGFKGFYIPASCVVHKTNVNYSPKIHEVPPEAMWKFYYQARNTTYMTCIQKKNKLIAYLSILNKYRKYLHRIKRISDPTTRKKLKEIVKKGCKEGLSFRPAIEYIQRPSEKKGDPIQ